MKWLPDLGSEWPKLKSHSMTKHGHKSNVYIISLILYLWMCFHQTLSSVHLHTNDLIRFWIQKGQISRSQHDQIWLKELCLNNIFNTYRWIFTKLLSTVRLRTRMICSDFRFKGSKFKVSIWPNLVKTRLCQEYTGPSEQRHINWWYGVEFYLVHPDKWYEIRFETCSLRRTIQVYYLVLNIMHFNTR